MMGLSRLLLRVFQKGGVARSILGGIRPRSIRIPDQAKELKEQSETIFDRLSPI